MQILRHDHHQRIQFATVDHRPVVGVDLGYVVLLGQSLGATPIGTTYCAYAAPAYERRAGRWKSAFLSWSRKTRSSDPGDEVVLTLQSADRFAAVAKRPEMTVTLASTPAWARMRRAISAFAVLNSTE